MESVIIADGKVDSASGDPKILMDTIRAIRLEDVTDEMREAEEIALEHSALKPASLSLKCRPLK